MLNFYALKFLGNFQFIINNIKFHYWFQKLKISFTIKLKIIDFLKYFQI